MLEILHFLGHRVDLGLYHQPTFLRVDVCVCLAALKFVRIL